MLVRLCRSGCPAHLVVALAVAANISALASGTQAQHSATGRSQLTDSVRADPEQARNFVALKYEVGEVDGCPDEIQLRQAIADLVGYDPFLVSSSRTVTVEIAPAQGGMVGVVSWHDPEETVGGERRFEPEASCEALTRNIAFALAVQIQLLNVPEPEPASPVPEPVAPPPAPPQEPPRAPPPPRPEPSPMELGAGVGPRVVFGWAPTAAAAGSLFVLVRGRTLSAEAAFETSLPSEHERGDGQGFRIALLSGSLAPCLRFPVLEMCSVLRLGQVRVRGFGVDKPRSPTGFMLQLGFRVGWVHPVAERLGVRLHLEVGRTLTDWTVNLNGNDAFTLPPFSLALGIDAIGLFL